MSFLEIANGNLLYLLVIIGIAYIFLQSLIFLRMSMKRAKELAISRTCIKNIVKSSIVFTIAPSIAIVLGLAALAPSLGIPWPWLRLSVIGSLSYEIMAANMASSALGFTSLADASAGGANSLGTIMLAMTTGVAGGMILDIFLIKKVNHVVIKMKGRSGDFGTIALSVLFFAVLVVFVGPIFGQGAIYILTFFTSMALAFLQGVLIKKYRMTWLKNFVLSFSLILGMCSSILWTALFR